MLLSLLAVNLCTVAASLLLALLVTLLVAFLIATLSLIAALLLTAFCFCTGLVAACICSLVATCAVSALGSCTLLCLLRIIVASARNGSEHRSSHCQ